MHGRRRGGYGIYVREGEAVEALTGRAWQFGDHVSTDAIVPGRYLKLSYKEASTHLMEGADPDFVNKARPGDIVVGGINFGCGSSRESAPAALKEFGIQVVVAKFFGRIFYRNAINIGLPVLECHEASQIQTDDELAVDLESGQIRNLTQGTVYQTTPFPPHIMAMVRAGGLVPYMEQSLRSGQISAAPAPPPSAPRIDPPRVKEGE